MIFPRHVRWFTALLAAASSQLMAVEIELDGEFRQGGLVFGYTTPGATVKMAGEPVRVSDDGRFVLGFNRKEPGTVTLEVTALGGDTETRTLQIASREYATQRIDGLPSKMVSPSEADLARIRADQKLINAARAQDTARPYFASGFEWPLVGRVTGVYGSQRVLNGEPRQPHYGIDIAAPTGTQVVAPADGVVNLVHDDMYFTGGTLMIDHGHGLTSAFLHLSKVLVEEGQEVRRGDPIAEVGSTGRSTGPHLDWRINWFKRRIDPMLIVGDMPAAQ